MGRGLILFPDRLNFRESVGGTVSLLAGYGGWSTCK